MDRHAISRQEVRDLLRAVGIRLPPAGAEQRICSTISNEITALFRNYDQNARVQLEDLRFDDIDAVDRLTQLLVSWREVYEIVGGLIPLSTIRLCAAPQNHRKVIVELQNIQIAIGQVISRGIARLARLNDIPAPDINLDEFFNQQD